MRLLPKHLGRRPLTGAGRARRFNVLARAHAGRAKVGELGAPRLADQHVARLQVAVHDGRALRVQVGDTQCDLSRPLELQRQRDQQRWVHDRVAVQHVVERVEAELVHHTHVPTLHAPAEELGHVRVLQPGHDVHLADKRALALLLRTGRAAEAQLLDGHLHAAPPRTEHDSERAHSDPLSQLELGAAHGPVGLHLEQREPDQRLVVLRACGLVDRAGEAVEREQRHRARYARALAQTHPPHPLAEAQREHSDRGPGAGARDLAHAVSRALRRLGEPVRREQARAHYRHGAAEEALHSRGRAHAR
mmetsp:Transcript_15452/g.39198  ORF Transcript_15452/g.39198 Transcript_15452/m.39198 type:complete len:305 (-) Transcript_15452:462-1376(-)